MLASVDTRRRRVSPRRLDADLRPEHEEVSSERRILGKADCGPPMDERKRERRRKRQRQRNEKEEKIEENQDDREEREGSFGLFR